MENFRKLYLLIGFFVTFAPISECGIISSIWDFFTGGTPVANLTRTCLVVPKNLHEAILSNDCESVENDPSMPLNKLVKSNRNDTLRKPYRGNIDLTWLVGSPYKSPYSGEETHVQFSFAISYKDDPLQNKLLNPVEPHKTYKKGGEKYYAKHLTAMFVAKKADPSRKAIKVINKKSYKPELKPPKMIRCGKPIKLKIRFYTNEVANYTELDYMYLTYQGILTGC